MKQSEFINALKSAEVVQIATNYVAGIITIAEACAQIIDALNAIGKLTDNQVN